MIGQSWALPCRVWPKVCEVGKLQAEDFIIRSVLMQSPILSVELHQLMRKVSGNWANMGSLLPGLTRWISIAPKVMDGPMGALILWSMTV